MAELIPEQICSPYRSKDDDDQMEWTSSPSPFGYDGGRSLAGSLCSSPFIQFSPSYASGETDSGISTFSPSIFSPSKIALNTKLFEKKVKGPVLFDYGSRDVSFVSSSHDSEVSSICNLAFQGNYFLTKDDKPYDIVQTATVLPERQEPEPSSSTYPKVPPLRISIPQLCRDIDDEPNNFCYPEMGPEVPVTRSLLVFDEPDPLDAAHDNSIISWGQGNFYCVRDVSDGHLSVRVRHPGTPDHNSDPFSFENMTNRCMLDSPDNDDMFAVSSIEKRKKFSDELNAFTSPLGYLREDVEDRNSNIGLVETPTQCKCKKSQCLKLYCDCFALLKFCGPKCGCFDCRNDPLHDEARNVAIAATMQRTATAFKNKVTPDSIHVAGCHCAKSNCLKKYCECFLGAALCGVNCRCKSCKNYQGSVALELIRSNHIGTSVVLNSITSSSGSNNTSSNSGVFSGNTSNSASTINSASSSNFSSSATSRNITRVNSPRYLKSAKKVKETPQRDSLYPSPRVDSESDASDFSDKVEKEGYTEAIATRLVLPRQGLMKIDTGDVMNLNSIDSCVDKLISAQSEDVKKHWEQLQLRKKEKQFDLIDRRTENRLGMRQYNTPKEPDYGYMSHPTSSVAAFFTNITSTPPNIPQPLPLCTHTLSLNGMMTPIVPARQTSEDARIHPGIHIQGLGVPPSLEADLKNPSLVCASNSRRGSGSAIESHGSRDCMPGEIAPKKRPSWHVEEFDLNDYCPGITADGSMNQGQGSMGHNEENNSDQGSVSTEMNAVGTLDINLESAQNTSVSHSVKRRKMQETCVVYPFFGRAVPSVPKVVALRVLEYLDSRELYSASCLNTLWCKAAMDEALWE